MIKVQIKKNEDTSRWPFAKWTVNLVKEDGEIVTRPDDAEWGGIQTGYGNTLDAAIADLVMRNKHLIDDELIVNWLHE